MQKCQFRLVGAGLAALLMLAGCATAQGGQTGSSSSPNADWENLGVTPNGNTMHELDKLSIKRQGNKVTFRDRKTIFNLAKENFLTVPRHKHSLNTWEIDCANQTYRLLDTTLYDENNRLVVTYRYSEQESRSQPISSKSASEQQKQRVCPAN